MPQAADSPSRSENETRGVQNETGARSDHEPEGTDRRTSLPATLERTVTEFMEDNLTDWAAALTYYALLALFPALIALVSILGVFGDPKTTTKSITDIITSLGPQSAADTFSGPIESITSNRSAAGIGLVAGLIAALWAASGYIGAFMRASNIIYETPEGRPIWKLRPLQMLVTLVMVILMAVLATALVLTGPVVEAVAEPLGVSGTAVAVWEIAKWPVMAVLFVLMISFLYYASPNAKPRGFRFVTPGSLLALFIWVLASAGFAIYMAQFGSYSKTYGSLAGGIVLLMWFWITNLAILFGHQLNAELERSLEIGEGQPRAHKEIQLEPRADPKARKTT